MYYWPHLTCLATSPCAFPRLHFPPNNASNGSPNIYPMLMLISRPQNTAQNHHPVHTTP